MRRLFWLLGRMFGYHSIFIVAEKNERTGLRVDTFGVGKFYPDVAEYITEAVKKIKKLK